MNNAEKTIYWKVIQRGNKRIKKASTNFSDKSMRGFLATYSNEEDADEAVRTGICPILFCKLK